MRRPFLFCPRESARAPDRGRSSSPDRVRYRSSGRFSGRPPGPLELSRSGPLPPTLPDPLAVQLGRDARPLRPRSVPVVRDPRAVVRDRWPVIVAVRHPDNVQLECPLFAQVLEPRAPNVRTWAAGHGPRTAIAGEFFDVHGPQKRAGFVKARAFARFHTLDVLQNSSSPAGRGPPPPGRKKPPRLINLSTRAKICAKFFSMDPE